MYKSIPYLLTLCSLSFLHADEEEALFATTPEVASTDSVEAHVKTSAFSPFSGKVVGKKVRLRTTADLEGAIVQEMNKDDLLSIVGEKGDFYKVAPPEKSKAYVFRSFVLDNTVVGNRVNVRLEPNLDAPVIGHLAADSHIEGEICANSPKWLQIAAPKDTVFYISKEYVKNVGGPEYKVHMDKRKAEVEQFLESASLLNAAEFKKDYKEIDLSKIEKAYSIIVSDFEDFPNYVAQAKEALTSAKDLYLQKKIAYLEERASKAPPEDVLNDDSELELVASEGRITDKMKLWETVEEAIYLSWASSHPNVKDMSDYYEDQMLAAETLHGMVESYSEPVRNAPGSFILRDKDNRPKAYLYSTKVNLQDCVGKKVTLLAAQRPNNNFAFPAYFVLAEE